MSKTLPFIQPPAEARTRRCGTPATGILEFPVYGGITVGESSAITELMASEQSSFVYGARIADAIAKAESISISEAFSIIEQAVRGADMEPDADAIRIRYAAQIEEVAKVYATAGKRSQAATVTALIRCRLNLPDWGLADTATLLAPLFNDIWDLAEYEQSAEDAPPAEAPDDELLGKPPVESGNVTKRTGRRSRGT